MANILGLFETADMAADAAGGLGNAGFTQDQWEVLTGSPYPEGAFGEREPKHALFRFPLMGAIIGFSIGLLYTVGTQIAYPVVSGGKPIVAIPPMLIIMYEFTMLGAIIFTVLGLIIESRLPRLGGPGLYDPRVTEGYIALVVDAPPERLGEAEEAFRRAGAVEIKRQS